MTDILTSVLLLIGAFFLLVAAIGLLRMPDLFMRMSSATKGTTLGVGCMLLAVGFAFPGFGISTRSVAGVAFFFATTPVAAHMIARAAYFIGVPLWKGTVRDDLGGRYDHITHELGGRPRENLAGRAPRRIGPPPVIHVPRPRLPFDDEAP